MPWHALYGDRSQQLVFIGLSLDRSAIIAALDACLVGAEEAGGGMEAWAAWHSPFEALL